MSTFFYWFVATGGRGGVCLLFCVTGGDEGGYTGRPNPGQTGDM